MRPHVARKRFGQNFLVDQQIIADIVDLLAVQRDDLLVEIGPGLGALTGPLLRRLDHLHVVEIDRDIVARLRQAYSPGKLTVHAGDALVFDFGEPGQHRRYWPAHRRQSPYNISTPLLFHLAGFGNCVRDMHFMLQKEVVERMVADPAVATSGACR
jgi:16S rRNA (adenine1518-N6/adenine1519-N6)-dimethyltransferase